ncbi:DNA primase [Amylibacter sp. IMCC11727]|uniref:DNA primase n=1 Tax=Amylibacter sp. IMCC11727 TaxID=3039851 RepID=UPI00244E2C7B|nr:DNA primase [Amylibacter sp. IMCC11727]WGI20938.1 DNA primase [Amylibacter sp. IMCC11727]
MSLPDGFLDELRTRLSIAQVVGRKVTWDTRKSNVGKGDYWSPCPFHQEKTASFHVDDRKGFFYCFGCHAKGDALTFVRETENVGFMEAVEILAGEAGMPVPKRDPVAQKKADQRTVLAEIMEQALQFYRMQLKTNVATAARDYLDGRGMPQVIQDRFEIGFAPDTRSALFQHLTGKGIKPEDLDEAGLCVKPDDGGSPFDRFRGRIIFPIRDARGRCIAFGGRAMDPNARAKYLNSPETPLFDKGRSLYNHGPAREAAGKAQSLIVAEGYMDVIALAQAGFDHAVAPLGTAITENQLQLMWRMSPEPIIALDGDTAGIRAARRLIDLALPLMEAGKSLRFVVLPEGQDPDDLLKASGAKAMQDLLDAAQPMVRLLWEREIEGKVFDSPERRASLDASLRTALSAIKDPSLRNHYTAAIKELRAELFAPKHGTSTQQNAPWSGGWRNKPPQNATSGLKSSLLGQKTATDTTRLREALILAAAIRNPHAAVEHETMLEKSPIAAPDLIKIQSALLALLHMDLSEDQGSGPLIAALTDRLGFNPMDHLMTLPPVRIHPHLHPDADPELVAMTLREELVKHAAIKGAEAELRDAEEEVEGLADEGLTWRIQQASEARANATKADIKSGGDGSEDRENLSLNLQKMIDDQIWVKKKG